MDEKDGLLLGHVFSSCGLQLFFVVVVVVNGDDTKAGEHSTQASSPLMLWVFGAGLADLEPGQKQTTGV